jgi:hypothetical protein
VNRQTRFVVIAVSTFLTAAVALGLSPSANAGASRARRSSGTLLGRGSVDLRALASPRRASGLPVDRAPIDRRALRILLSRHVEREPTETAGSEPPGAAAAPILPIQKGHPEVLQSIAGLDITDQIAVNNGNPLTAVEPPDQGLCVGNGFVLETVNTVLRVFRTSGKPAAGPVALNEFYRYPPIESISRGFGPVLADPSCTYDADTGRWFHTVLTLEVDPKTGTFLGPNHLDIAVSRTSDPTGRWSLFSIPAQNDGTDGTPDHGCVGANDAGHGPCVGDFPQIGLDRNGFFITTNEYTLFGTSQFTGADLYAMSKFQLAKGGSSIDFTLLGPLRVPELDEPGFTVFPANGSSSDQATDRNGTMYFVSTTASSFELGGDGTSSDLVLWALSNTASLADASPSIKLRHVVLDSQRYSVPPSAGQRPGNIPLQDCLNDNCFRIGAPPTPETLKQLDAGDSRTGDATISHGTVVAVWDTGATVDGQPHDAIAYAEIHPSASGVLSASVGLHGIFSASGENLLYPSIAYDADGAGFIGFSITGPHRFPGVGYAPVALGHRPSLIRIAARGLGPDDGFTGTFLTAPDDRARWGDYGAAVPGAGGTIWIAHEYIGQTCTDAEYRADITCGGTRTALANWGTRLVQLRP